MPAITIVPRIELPTGQPALFMRDANELTCYTLREGHAPASRAYYLTRTIPADPNDPAVVRLVRNWCTGPGLDGVTVRVRARLGA
jgi:hypothetical protein